MMRKQMNRRNCGGLMPFVFLLTVIFLLFSIFFLSINFVKQKYCCSSFE